MEIVEHWVWGLIKIKVRWFQPILLSAFSITEFGVATAHPNDALCVGIKISISIHSIQVEIFIPTQNSSFG